MAGAVVPLALRDCRAKLTGSGRDLGERHRRRAYRAPWATVTRTASTDLRRRRRRLGFGKLKECTYARRTRSAGGTVVAPELHRAIRCRHQGRPHRRPRGTAFRSISKGRPRVIDASGKFVIPGRHRRARRLLRRTESDDARSIGDVRRHGRGFRWDDDLHRFRIASGRRQPGGAIEGKQVEMKKDKPDIDYALHAMITGERDTRGARRNPRGHFGRRLFLQDVHHLFWRAASGATVHG